MKLGENLVASGVIDDAQLGAALSHATTSGTRLGAALIALGHATGDQIAIALGKQLGVAAARDRHLAAAPQALAPRLPADLARELGCVIVGEGRDRELIIAMQDPLDVAAIAKLERATRRVVVPAAASSLRIEAAIERIYPVGGADIASAAAAAAEIHAARSSRSSIPGVPASVAAAAVSAGGTATAVEPVEHRRHPIATLDLDAPPPSLDLPPLEADPEATPPPRSLESIGLAMGSAPEMTPLAPLPRARPKTTTIPGNQIIPTTRRMAQIAGGTSLSARRGAASSGSFGLRPLFKIVTPLIVIASIAFTYRHYTSDSSWAVTSDYNSTYLHAHFPLPGTGWRSDSSLRMEKTRGDGWARVEGVYRGGTADDPDEILMLIRTHSPGEFPEVVDMDDFRRGLDAVGRMVTSSAEVSVQTIECAVDSRVRTEPAGRCRGTATYRSELLNIYLYLWEDTVDDVAAVIYVAKGKVDDHVGELESFITDIQLQPQ